ncbi:MAG: C protein [Angavokely henipavirus]|nr:MAG: C protein [Angavokely henipavirus]
MGWKLSNLLSRTGRQSRKRTEGAPLKSLQLRRELENGKISSTLTIKEIWDRRGYFRNLKILAKRELLNSQPLLMGEMLMTDLELNELLIGIQQETDYSWTQWLQTLLSMTVEGKIPTYEMLTRKYNQGVISEIEMETAFQVLHLMELHSPALAELLQMMRVGHQHWMGRMLWN